MRNLLCMLTLILAAQRPVTTTDAEPLPQYGPPASPLSWQDVAVAKADSAAQFSPRRNVFGVAKQPAAVKMVEFNDDRPYGEVARQTVWLARYESVSLLGPDGKTSASVNMSVVFSPSGDLLCAFTDPAPRWAKPAKSRPIEDRIAQERWEMSPAHHGELRATLTDVLKAVWTTYGVNPSNTGQVIVRPRFVANTFPADRINGKLVPRNPPANVWIVEVLGTAVLKDHNIVFTTLIAELRDDDLGEIIGMRWY